MAEWAIEPLAGHQRADFDCGQRSLNDWLKLRATQYARRNLARTYVLVRPGQARVFGYYALSTRHIDFAHVPPERARGLPVALPLPVALIGQLAVDRSLQGQGLGEVLLIDALRRILGLAEQIGILAVLVEAIDESARRFYLHQGFEPLADDPSRLFLTLKELRAAGLEPLGNPGSAAQ